MSENTRAASGKTPGPCPICTEAGVAKFRPFCSKRCADIDLGRWFNESYAVPAVEPPDEWDMPDAGGDPDRDSDASSLLH
jgi:hypothetical protein